MSASGFSLKERDKKRFLKDRIARLTVTGGGVGVLAAILLLFVYLLMIVTPLFSDGHIESKGQYNFAAQEDIVAVGVGEYGENAYLFDDNGQVRYLSFKGDSAQTVLARQVISEPSSFAAGDKAHGWYAYGNNQGEVVAVKPSFQANFTAQGRVLTPELKRFYGGKTILLDPQREAIVQLSFAIAESKGTFVGVTASGQAYAAEAEQLLPDSSTSVWKHKAVTLPGFPQQTDKLLLSPDGRQLFVLSGNDLIVMSRKADKFRVREIVDLSRDGDEKSVSDIALLAGAQSLMVSYSNNTVSQWFDVLKSGQRHLTQIRSFQLNSPVSSLIMDPFRKGFYSLHYNGELKSFYTTSERELFSEAVLDTAPLAAGLSGNERYLITAGKQSLQVFQIENAHPEVSFYSLWNKVWYENYPEPEFVWQSTSASDDFEAKFSLIPIAFGTLKATFYTMLFSVPIAIMGAIYTAYFMSSPMRSAVKPAVELMEALPTVIIGFLAGIWLAPIIENNLTGVVSMMILLPLSALLVGLIWSLFSNVSGRRLPGGWHSIALVPVFLIIIFISLNSSTALEQWLFNGDVRIFLSEYGLDYDQRNALIVGMAMGFAVIPTIFTIAEDAIFSVPKHLSDGSLALGATQWQTLIYVVLLTASPGIFSAVMIGLGRAVGETMIVLMATGNTPIMDLNIFDGMRSLAATIAVEMPESEVGGTHYRLLFLAALLLFIFTFFVNSLAEIVRQRLKEKYSSM